jgi:hypothetical protein
VNYGDRGLVAPVPVGLLSGDDSGPEVFEEIASHAPYLGSHGAAKSLPSPFLIASTPTNRA